MRILAVSDEESKAFYDYYTPGILNQFDMILACGDLRREYLEFLVTLSNKPLLYVRGNHDDDILENPPEGCICVDGRLYVQNGIRILGLGGSFRYRPGNNMYTERQMRLRILRLLLRIRMHKGFDILLTHAPARNLGDLDTAAHRGFVCFSDLLDRYHPRYFIHGHVHKSYGVHIPTRTVRGSTTIINACGYQIIEY
ncbi:MAG: metallophosphoesterase family protein [Oscillospiraceae bacterium]|nr:metallophosphoesterase family protein [Oscillospiraceae bacterium]